MRDFWSGARRPKASADRTCTASASSLSSAMSAPDSIALGVQADQSGEPLHHHGIIARQDLQAHAARGEPGDGRRRGRLRRIGEGAKTFEDKIDLVLRFDLARCAGPGARSDGDGPQALSRRAACTRRDRSRHVPPSSIMRAAPRCVHRSSTASGAPLTISSAPSGPVASTDPSRREKSNACRPASVQPCRGVRLAPRPARHRASRGRRRAPAAMAPSRARARIVGAVGIETAAPA